MTKWLTRLVAPASEPVPQPVSIDTEWTLAATPYNSSTTCRASWGRGE